MTASTASNPYFTIAKQHGLDYGVVLRYADAVKHVLINDLDHGYSERRTELRDAAGQWNFNEVRDTIIDTMTAFLQLRGELPKSGTRKPIAPIITEPETPEGGWHGFIY